MPQWLANHLLWVTLASIACTVVLTGIGVLVVVLLPADYFDHSRRRPVPSPRSFPFFHLLLRIVKNIMGVLFIFFGIILAIPGVPGPGLLFILLGVTMIDLPGKFTLQRRLIGNRMVLKSVNLLRSTFKRPPFTFSLDPPSVPSATGLRGEIIP